MQLIVIIIFIIAIALFLGFMLKGNNNKYDKDTVINEFNMIRKKFFKANKNLDELNNNILKKNLKYKFKLDKNNKFLMLKIEDKILANDILKDLPKSSYYEYPWLYLGIYGEVIKKSIPIVEIIISPENITTTSKVNYSFKEISGKKHKIKNIIWEGNKDYFENPGEYKVKLRVENDKGVSSEVVEKIIKVEEVKGVKGIASSNEVLFIIHNNGHISYKAFDDNKLGLKEYEAFRDYEIVSNVDKLSMNYNHILVKTNDGHIKAAGSNGFGQLAITSKSDKKNFIEIWGLENVIKVDTGYEFSGALTKKGDLFLWGLNDSKQIRFKTNMYYDMPQKINNIKNVVDFSLGRNHCLIKDKSNKLYSFGSNEFGQLGNGYSESTFEVQEVLLLGVDIFYAGDEYCLAVNNKGDLYGWGKNNKFQLGEKSSRVKKPEIVNPIKNVIYITGSNNFVVVVTETGGIYTWGTFYDRGEAVEIIRPKEIKGCKSIKGITISNDEIYVLTKDDELFKSNKDFELDKINFS